MIDPPVKNLPTVITPRANRLKAATGSASEEFTRTLLDRVWSTIFRPGDKPADQREREMHAAMTALAAFKPTDEIEGMLAAQGIALHHAMMELTRRAMIEDQPHQVAQDYRNSSVKLNRGFIEVLDALDRKRGKHRRQVVRVERVTVQSGGQAIVGDVSGVGNAGGGHGTEIDEEPREPAARLAHDAASRAVMPTLRGKEPCGEPVPTARDAREDAVPLARRRQHRAAHPRRD